MCKHFLALGALSAFLAVAMGAFGAHGLKHILSPEMLEVFKTGVNYQMWHALGLLLVAILQQQLGHDRYLSWSGNLFLIGMLLFSGSLYVLTIFNMKWIGMITPLGGLAFLAGWLCLAWTAKGKRD